jgi:hypothetical protein
MSQPNGSGAAMANAGLPSHRHVAKKSCSVRFGHFSMPAAVTTDWATSAIFLFSFIAVLRSKP